jgi:2-(1,2-epoxy-1,2-dihydrophenyl)acetyl-CoA isomerase
LEQQLADPTVRAVVLTGVGKTFSTGADVKQFREASQGRDPTSAVGWVLDTTAELHPLLLAIRASEKVVVAAVNGVAAGGGLGLALAADVRIGGPEARFAAGYFGLGLSPDGGSTWLLPRLIGEQRTRQFFFTNEVMAAEEAHFTGILDELVAQDEVVPRALKVAAEWGKWSRHARESTKRLLDGQSTGAFASHLDLERGLIASAAGTPEFRQGVEAFFAARKPTK